MSRALEMMQQALSQTLGRLWSILQTFSWNPLEWSSAIWLVAVVTLIVAWLLSLLLQRPFVKVSRPELLVSKGIVKQCEEQATQVLTLKVSNLNDYAVQLLEMSVQSDLMPAPFLIEAAEILSPHGAVELEAVLPNKIVGEAGLLEIYVLLSKRRNKLYRLRTRFEWEPWANRYKVEATGQQLRRVYKLASTRFKQVRKRDWHQREASTQPHTINHDVEERREPFPRPATRQLDMDFPKDF